MNFDLESVLSLLGLIGCAAFSVSVVALAIYEARTGASTSLESFGNNPWREL
ncbi:MAG TPA: hypothetical protein VJU83_07140 [Burkholderiales bacterium]|nr:hypothetical protein [Burkholderiales bacterium]